MAPEKPASSSYATDGSCSSIELRRQSPHQKLQFASSDRARRAGAFLYVKTNVGNSSGSIRSTSSQHPSQDSAPIVVRKMQLANHDLDESMERAASVCCLLYTRGQPCGRIGWLVTNVVRSSPGATIFFVHSSHSNPMTWHGWGRRVKKYFGKLSTGAPWGHLGLYHVENPGSKGRRSGLQRPSKP